MVGVSFDTLYEHYMALSAAKDKIGEHTREYLEAIESTKGTEREKKLATQMIASFFKYFPTLQEQALEAIFDICEDIDPLIQIGGVKVLPSLCKDNKSYTGKVSDILAQLLQLEDAAEHHIVCTSLTELLHLDAKSVIKNLFKQINERDNEVRDKCLKFLLTKVKGMDKSIITPEVEDVMITEVKNSLVDISGQEYVELIDLLKSTRISQSFTGQQELVNMAVEKAELHKEFHPTVQNAQVDKLLTCIKMVTPYFSAKVESTKFVTYLCDKVLPKFDEIGKLEKGDLLQLAILRQLAELSTYCGQLDNPSLYVVQIYQKLKDYMPPPPEDTTNLTMPILEFSLVECLLYAFHRLARQCPDFLTHDPQVLKEFRSRLTYFSRGVQDKKTKTVAPKLLSNITTLIRDLFYQPPKYQCVIKLSFKSEEIATAAKTTPEKISPSGKRHTPITFESNGSATQNKQSRGDGVPLYTPPSGKFSSTFSNRGRGRGARGRGNPRSWRK
ncbi:apoptosis inhibitor 5 isoform X2 [Photinus pyralis]|uniref:Apoptosis inhibitor 5/fibroblast growth factor 2-interacting factor 2 n=1 Tax=Photinus pyralis TaxID=7054 RepID=A0A1Y1KPL6_PHOPY|nr:apoptosis inhibitor 5 isoform X2 [Photinus pyralis]